MKLVPEHVEGARGMLGLTIEDLAKAAGVGEATLRNFVSHRRVPHDSTLQKIQEALERRGIEFTNGDNPGVRLVRDKATIPTR